MTYVKLVKFYKISLKSYISLCLQFVGTCDEDYLEVRVGGRKGMLIGKYCKVCISSILKVCYQVNLDILVWTMTLFSIKI